MTVYDYDNRQFQMTVFLSCPSIELGESVDQIWNKFSAPIIDAIQSFVPKKAVHTRPSKIPDIGYESPI